MYPPTGKRPRQGLVSMPRGNGKSGLAAALAVYGLLADGVAGAQVIVVASDERQARIVFNAARRMIELDERLAEQVQVFTDRIYVPATDSTMMPLPAEPAALQRSEERTSELQSRENLVCRLLLENKNIVHASTRF